MTADPFTTAALVARALCEDAGVRLAPSTGGWAWVPSRRTILVDRADLAARGLEACVGIVAHEVGHARVTRGMVEPGEDLPGGLAHLLHNALEDTRCEAWIADRYPGAAAWLRAARRAHANGPLAGLPTFVQFAVTAADAASLEPDAAPAEVAEEVARVLARTRDARRAYRDTRPDADLSAWVEGGAVRAGRGEVGVQAAADAATAILQRDVRAAFAALVDEDARTFAGARCALGVEADRLLQAGDWPRIRRVAGDGGDATADQLDSARQALGKWAARLRGEPGPLPRALEAARERGRDGARGPERGAASARDLEHVRPHAARLAEALAPVFPPRRPSWGRTPRESGGRPSMPAAMRLEADPRADPRVWRRRTPGAPRTAAVTLLVDLSGSMRGRSIANALDGAAMLVLALGRLGMPLSVVGFQDVLIPVLPFGVHAPTEALPLLGRLALEVVGLAPGGRNRPSHNDDGPCVDEAARLLAARSERDRVLLVLSDGHPEGRRSSPADLHAAVARWSGPRSPVRLVGLGLGEGATHVKRYYPDAVAGVLPEELPRTLARVLARVLGGGDRGVVGR